jgi:hypothetical protein
MIFGGIPQPLPRFWTTPLHTLAIFNCPSRVPGSQSAIKTSSFTFFTLPGGSFFYPSGLFACPVSPFFYPGKLFAGADSPFTCPGGLFARADASFFYPVESSA